MRTFNQPAACDGWNNNINETIVGDLLRRAKIIPNVAHAYDEVVASIQMGFFKKYQVKNLVQLEFKFKAPLPPSIIPTTAIPRILSCVYGTTPTVPSAPV